VTHERTHLTTPRLAVVAALVTVTLSGCTEAGLEPVLRPGAFRDDKITVVGDLCTSAPESRVFPLRVLFVVDGSESMRVTDPPDPVTLVSGRERAFRDTWEQLLAGDPAGVRIGLVQFSADAQGRTLVDEDGDGLSDTYYTANRQLLDDATAGLQVTGRTTNYLGALNEAFVAMRTELSDADQESLPLSKYVVIFVSDGLPDVDSEDDEDTIDEQILDAVDDLRELAELFRVGEFEFHAAYLSAGEGPALDREAQRLLQQMADVGGGNFRSFPSGESLNFVFVDLTVIRRVFTLRSLAVANMNVIVDDDQIADYLFEDRFDPFAPDGGVDGGPFQVQPRERLRDVRPPPIDGGMEDAGPMPDGGVDGGPPFPDERNFVDEDGDGQPSCSERLVDTDGDGLSDLIEKGIADAENPPAMWTPWLTEDTDDDGLRDRLEWQLASSGLSPFDPSDSGCFVPEPCLQITDPETGQPTAVDPTAPALPGSTSDRDTYTYGCGCVIDLRRVVVDPAAPEGFSAEPVPDGVCDACDPLADPEDAFFCVRQTLPDPRTGEPTEYAYDCVDRDAPDPETGEPLGDGFCDCVDRDEDGLCDWFDRDGDGLRDCEEIFYGTAQNGNDTDADGLPDLIETRLESNPVEPDALDDNDFDRTVNSLEVRAGTDPWCDDAAIRSLVSYRYDQTTEAFEFGDGGVPVPFEPIDAGPVDGGGVDGDTPVGSGLVNARSCYRFEVGNVTVVPTEPNYEGRYPGNGWNRILVWAGEVAFDDPDAFAFFRIACAMVFYEPDGNYRNPPSGRLRFTNDDFVEAREFDADVHCRWP